MKKNRKNIFLCFLAIIMALAIAKLCLITVFIHNFFYDIFSFRNVGHEGWFYFAVVLLIEISAISLILRIKNNMKYLAYFFFIESLMAISTISFEIDGHSHSQLYSFDCIWFNALMGGLSLIMAFVIKKNK